MMDIDATRLIDVSLSVLIALIAIVQMSKAHADCRRSQEALADRLLRLLEKLTDKTAQ